MFALVSISPLIDPLWYSVPTAFKADSKIGTQVEVPLGSRTEIGYIVLTQESVELDYEVKEILSKPIPCFRDLWLPQWISKYYQEPLSKVLDTAAPKIIPIKKTKWVNKKNSRQFNDPKIEALLAKIPCKVSEVKSKKTLKNALDLELVQITEQEEIPAAPPVPDWVKREVVLNKFQESAVEKISKGGTCLLFGATGSGKTEVYIELAKKTLKNGKGVLFLVPEIALTPQLIDRVRGRLDCDIALLHSGMSARLKYYGWRQCLSGKAKVAIGARSAIFAPLEDIGLIIVDEEHDSSYKQSEGLRYNARDLAHVLAKKHGATLVLGSATPSLESYSLLKEIITLPPQSANHVSLQSTVIDLTKSRNNPSPHISDKLKLEIDKALTEHEQVLLLYNRRGFASYLFCSDCNKPVSCPNCSVTLTFYKRKNTVQCHYCNHTQLAPQTCCGKELKEVGAGTERIFEEVSELFPTAKVARLDRESITTMDEYREILEKVRSHEIDILIGTQMIAKGHDLPNVTLVGVLNCDIGLHMPDFRAGEKTFQLLLQAGGRAGRDQKPGRAFFQTRIPDHHAIKFAVKRDYVSFAELELKAREELGYPPFKKLLRILAQSENQREALEILSEMAHLIRDKIQVLGPSPCPIEKIKKNYRFHMLCKADKASELISIINHIKKAKWKKSIKVSFDIDPQDML